MWATHAAPPIGGYEDPGWNYSLDNLQSDDKGLLPGKITIGECTSAGDNARKCDLSQLQITIEKH